MRLISFGHRGRERAGVLVGGGVVPISALDPREPDSVRELLRNKRLPHLLDALRHYSGKVISLSDIRIGPPVPDPLKILCVGLNFAKHATEQGMTSPSDPLVFCKTPNALAGPYDDVRIPDAGCGMDYEVELAVVIGLRTCGICEGAAMQAVAGFMVANDVTARLWQLQDGQYYRSKSCDTFYPCGPTLVTTDEIDDYQSMRLQTSVNGQIRQDAPVGDMIHQVPAVIAYISRQITLEPGDIISMGSPPGSGGFMDPPTYITAGDKVECTISAIGKIANRFTGGSQSRPQCGTGRA